MQNKNLNTTNLNDKFNAAIDTNTYFKNIVDDIRVVADVDKFTQHEKDFVITFVADTLFALTQINCESRADGDAFVRMCDAREVLDNLNMLYEKHSEDIGVDWQKGEMKDEWTFTLADANTALCSYDTEYRDCITEQFEDACNDAACDKAYAKQDIDFTTLAARIFNASGYC